MLVAAQLPEHMRFYMEMKQQQLDDPATVELYRDLVVAIHWEADDPRVAAVADRLVGLLESAEAQEWETQDKEMTDELAELLDSVFLDSLPIDRRPMDLVEALGWRGWTKLERNSPDLSCLGGLLRVNLLRRTGASSPRQRRQPQLRRVHR